MTTWLSLFKQVSPTTWKAIPVTTLTKRYHLSDTSGTVWALWSFIYHLNLKDDIKVRFPEDKNTKAYNYEIISFLWQEVHAEDVSEGDLKAKESFVKAVQRYLRTDDGKTLKIKTGDLQQFEKQLVDSGL